MIESSTLLPTLQRQLKVLLDDLRHQVDTDPNVGDPLRAEYQAAFDAERTGWTFTEWSEDRLTQVAVGWLLACVFVRFGEDNALIDDAMLAGDGHRGVEARAAQQDFFRTNPHASDLDYLHRVFRNAAALPGLDGVLGEGHRPLWLVDPSADACTELLALFRRTTDDGQLELEFTDPELDTRFLGDLYQDLSEHAKKTYALLQTPVFVEEFILDRTLDPAIESHGLANTDLIDPTCGSGHFLLGAFDRLWQRWHDAEPGEAPAVTAQRALDAVWGVDLNPFAAAIARFRLLVAALRRCGLTRLADAPDFTIHVAVGDSLLWGAKEQHLPGMEGAGLAVDRLYLYATEDSDALRETFRRTYAAVVGNPPYIVPKDKAANAAYRKGYSSCSGQYSLGVPFTELFFRLARQAGSGQAAGRVGMITANSFMKREMGKRLIEDFIPSWDLTHVVDMTAIRPHGHPTPTVILLGRNQYPTTESIRLTGCIRGEKPQPADLGSGQVWRDILRLIDSPGGESSYVTVSDTPRSRFASHPWNIGAGGAADLKDRMDSMATARLGDYVEEIGRTAHTGEDEAYLRSGASVRTRGTQRWSVPVVVGEDVRDYHIQASGIALFPYDESGNSLSEVPVGLEPMLWPLRTTLRARLNFGQTNEERGLGWWEYSMFFPTRFKSNLSIAFPSVSSHNHFVLDPGGKVFNQSAPTIRLKDDCDVETHLGLYALLNSSLACFWMKQVFMPKPNPGDSAMQQRYDFDGTKLRSFPIPPQGLPIAQGLTLDKLTTRVTLGEGDSVADSGHSSDADRPAIADNKAQLLGLVTAQEELDWLCLYLFGLVDSSAVLPSGAEPPPLHPGERAFEITIARSGDDESNGWFGWNSAEPKTELPRHWPDWYRNLVERRIDLIGTDRNVGLIERPENKRRWNRPPWEELERAALRDWLLERLEDRSLWFEDARATVRTVAQLADRVATDADWMEVARTWVGHPDIDPLTVVTKLVADEHVPAQAAARYKPSGMTKRREWERTWDLQRAEDRGEDVGRIAVPPKYASSDFRKAPYWKHRGKLDVPKERFVSVHGAERDASGGDSTMVLAWAGFDHAQLAQALATLLFQRQTADGWSGERLIPLVAALDEVVPWVQQWHPDVDPSFGQPLGTFYRGLIDQALESIGATRATLAEWAPPAPTRGRAKAAAPSDTPPES